MRVDYVFLLFISFFGLTKFLFSRLEKVSPTKYIIRKRMVACSINFHGGWLWKSNIKRRKNMLTLLVEIERVRVFSLEFTLERV